MSYIGVTSLCCFAEIIGIFVYSTQKDAFAKEGFISGLPPAAHFRFNPVRSSNFVNLNRVSKNGIAEFLHYLEQKVKTVNATLLNIYKSKWNVVGLGWFSNRSHSVDLHGRVKTFILRHDESYYNAQIIENILK